MAGNELDAVDVIASQWRRERPDLDVTAMAVLGRLGRLTVMAQEKTAEVFSAHGLRRGEFDVLAALRRSGAPFELNPAALADSLMLSRAGMTGRLDRLESAGLVHRVAAAGDRRTIGARLSERGRELVDMVVTEHADNEQRMLSVLSSSDQRQLDRLTRKLLGEWESER